ncbi:MAG: DUF3347 domain-containing protein [Bacteroidota bacterium]|nr:DUF3347 domain-containing protein [Bacteroidota bacterium]
MKSEIIFSILLCITLTGSTTARAVTSDSTVLKISKDTTEKKPRIFNNEEKEQEIKFDKSNLAPQKVRIIFNDLFSQYLKIKDALSYSDESGAKRNTLTLLEHMKSKTEAIEIINKDERWILFLHNYESIRSKVEAANFIAEQRFLFGEISRGIQEFIKYYGLNDKTIYLMNCKNDEKNVNASWLTDSRDKKNPFLGSINDTVCSKVKEVWVF